MAKGTTIRGPGPLMNPARFFLSGSVKLPRFQLAQDLHPPLDGRVLHLNIFMTASPRRQWSSLNLRHFKAASETEIPARIADLRGKTVALQSGNYSDFGIISPTSQQANKPRWLLLRFLLVGA